MFLQVINIVKQKLLDAIEQELQYHPDFKDTLVRNHFPESESPARAIILTSSSGNHKRISHDDLKYSGLPSFSTLYKIENHSGVAIEWVKDDDVIIERDGIAPPGYYYIEITGKREDEGFEFTVDPLLTSKEIVVDYATGQETQASLSHRPLNSKVVWVQAMPPDGGRPRNLSQPDQFTVDLENQRINFVEPLIPRESVMVEYRYPGEKYGPFITYPFSAVRNAIQGIVICFGNRIEVGDRQVVGVDSRKVPSYDVYAGQWDISLDLTALALDPDDQEQLVDYASTILWAKRRKELEDNRMVIQDLSIGAESTDTLIEASDIPYFTATISLSLQTDWELFIPYIKETRSVGFTGYVKHPPQGSDENTSQEEIDSAPIYSTDLKDAIIYTETEVQQLKLERERRFLYAWPRIQDFKLYDVSQQE